MSKDTAPDAEKMYVRLFGTPALEKKRAFQVFKVVYRLVRECPRLARVVHHAALAAERDDYAQTQPFCHNPSGDIES
jgi:hypothetical protein